MDEKAKPRLREGFTTGTAASAASFAAVSLLLGLALPPEALVVLPPFQQDAAGVRPVGGAVLSVPLDRGRLASPDMAWAEVIKDGGDDPDATHGIRIRAYASFRPFSPALLPPEALRPGGRNEAPPLPPMGGPLAIPCPLHTVFLYAGRGIGTVTLPGLPVAAGEPAINPEPRRQIAFAAKRAAEQTGYRGEIHIFLCAEDGEKRARQTLNGRLGILGGISILGTRGTVKPYSHEAWQESILQSLAVAEALGIKELLLCTGRRSERLGFTLYPQLPAQAGVQAADFAAFTLRRAAKGPFRRLHWICFPGKLLKLAQGLEWTHAKAAESDMGLLYRLCRDEGAGTSLLRELKAMPTAAGAFSLLLMHDKGLHGAVLGKLGEKAYAVMRAWIEESAPGWTANRGLDLHVFSLEERLLFSRS